MKIFKHIGQISLNDIVDCMGNRVPFKMGEIAWVYFIDPTPDANWSHPAGYLAVPALGGEPEMVGWDWPPKDIEKWAEI
jgi:hypothetical protein